LGRYAKIDKNCTLLENCEYLSNGWTDLLDFCTVGKPSKDRVR
jgi:hypothetical protein